MVTTITSLIAISIIWILWQFLWKDYAIDKMRDDLFLIRSNLFNLAHKSDELNFQSDLYKSFEQLINNTIRFGYKINFLSTILLIAKTKVNFPKYKVRSNFSIYYNTFINSTKDLDVKKEINKIKEEYEFTILAFMFKTSTIFQICFGLVMIFIVIRNIFQLFKKNILVESLNVVKILFQKKYIRRFEYQAEYQN